jgi:hypothetical protein
MIQVVALNAIALERLIGHRGAKVEGGRRPNSCPRLCERGLLKDRQKSEFDGFLD